MKITAKLDFFAAFAFAGLVPFLLPAKESPLVAEETCRAVFLRAMADKARDIGTEVAYFENASGLTRKSRITVSDLLKLAVAGAKCERLAPIWSATEWEMDIQGPKARKVKLVHGYSRYKTYHEFIKSYKFLGGKGGTLYYPDYGISIRLFTLITEVCGEKVALAHAGLKHTDDPFVMAMKMLTLAGEAVRTGGVKSLDTVAELEKAGIAFAFESLGEKKVKYENKLSRKIFLPASTSKIITALCCLDVIKDLSSTMTVCSSDISGGSGITCHAGDVMTYEDALAAVMLPSANTVAKSISTNVGAQIIKNRNLGK